MERQRLSKTIGELIRYCEERQSEDPLLHPPRDNPFKEKRSCAVL
jgi:hypothetical protein